jgi:hypothetical protein
MASAEKLPTSPNDVYNTLFYVLTPGKLEEKQTKDGEKVVLWTMEFYDWRKRKGLIKAWKDEGKKLFDFFEKSINDKGHHLYSFRSGDDIPADDDRTLFLKAYEPNQFERNTYRFVYGLTTKLKSFNSKKLMTAKAFPKLVNWNPDLHLENGDLLPHPETWIEDEPPILLESMLYEVEDIDIIQPFKKPRNSNAPKKNTA